jgi:hypothetical protein
MHSRLLQGSLFAIALGSGVTALEACGLENGGTEKTLDASVGSAQDASEDAELDAGQDADLEAGRDASLDAHPEQHDAGQADADSCTGVRCAGQCLDAGDCRSCEGAPLLCGSGTCMPSCFGCRDSQGVATPIECFACDSNHANPLGTCQYEDAGAYCLSGDYSGSYQGGLGYRCGCNDVSACPGATQVCVPLGSNNAGFCLTCGENTVGLMQGRPCKDGGACQTAQALCQ